MNMDTNEKFIFDTADIEYLALHFTREQLRKEICNADIQESVARCYGEDGNKDYWENFGKACKLAIDTQKANQPKVEVKVGQFSVKSIKEANDIVDVISKYTNLKKTGKEYLGECPFHKDKTPSLQVSKSKQVFYCFSCQRKGDLINFIMQMEDVDAKQACVLLKTDNQAKGTKHTKRVLRGGDIWTIRNQTTTGANADKSSSTTERGLD